MRRHKGAGAKRLQLGLARTSHVWIDLNRYRGNYIHLAPDQSEPGPEAQHGVPKLKLSASRRRHSIKKFGALLGVNIYASLPHTIEIQLRRIFVFNDKRDRAIGSVLDMNTDFRFGSHRETAAELSREREALWQLAETRLDESGTEKPDVVREREPTQPWVAPRQR